jgi:hypothetical protein
LGGYAGSCGGELQRHPVNQQPGLAGQPRKDVELRVLEAGGGPDGNDRNHHHQGRDERCLGCFEGSLQP